MNKERTLMSCGHVAEAIDSDGNPTCTCSRNAKPVEKPNLEGRKARCVYCHSERDSSYELWFFQYNGPGSDKAENICKHCRYHRAAHERRDREEIDLKEVCHNFEPIGDTMDEHYDACRGND